MEDDWIFLGDGGGGGSDTDSASDAGSDSDDSGFTMIVRRGRKGGDAGCSVVVSADAPTRLAAVAVPQPTPSGLHSFKVVSYSEAFSASASDDSGGGQPGCNDEHDGIGSTDDCTVTCKEGCESGQVGQHDGNGSYVEAASSPSVAVVAAPTVNCPETTVVLHGEAHSELASGMDVDKGGAEEVEDEDSESCEEDADDDTENSSGDDDTDSSSEDDDTDSSSDDDDDTDSSSDDEDDETDSSSDEEDEDTFISSDEEYTESFSEEYSETCSVEENDDGAESSVEEEEDEDGSESSGELYYMESSDSDDFSIP